jgi:octaprenyl-diphosphate synthase
LIAPDLEKVETTIGEVLASDSTAVRNLMDHVSHFAGKRLRPSLILLVSKALGPVNDDHIKLSAVVELIHTATLVHDDILDGASMRRRMKSVNALHGNHVSVLLGDMIYARAFKLSLSLSTPEASQVLARVTQTICQGEIEQIFHRNNFDLEEEEYFSIIGAKTASLYRASCELAAVYSGAPPEVTVALGNYADSLGSAFQIVDDCLDIIGEEEVVGKSLGTDTERGKMTLPLIRMARTLPEHERKRLKEIFLSAEIEDKNKAINAEFNLIEAVDHAFEVADGLIRSALKELEVLPDSPYKQALVSAAEFVLIRKV